MSRKKQTKTSSQSENLPIAESMQAVLRNDKGEVKQAYSDMPDIEIKTNNVVRNLEMSFSSVQADDESLLHKLSSKVNTKHE